MAAEKKKVLIIENQFLQFELLVNGLKDDFLTLPLYDPDLYNREAIYTNFTDLVRVSLDDRYEKTKSDKAFLELLAYFTFHKPDILLIDHILLGYTGAPTGFNLASKIRKQYQDSNIPILFVSRSPREQAKVITGMLSTTGSRDWVNKSYYSGGVLEKTYIEKRIIPKINALLKSVKGDNSRDVILEILREQKVIEITERWKSADLQNLNTKIWLVRQFRESEINRISDFSKVVAGENEPAIEIFLKEILTIINDESRLS